MIFETSPSGKSIAADDACDFVDGCLTNRRCSCWFRFAVCDFSDLHNAFFAASQFDFAGIDSQRIDIFRQHDLVSAAAKCQFIRSVRHGQRFNGLLPLTNFDWHVGGIAFNDQCAGVGLETDDEAERQDGKRGCD